MTIQQKVITEFPENRETPLEEVQSWVTPRQWFFVRSHYDTPHVDLECWRLTICGCVERELSLTWEELHRLPRRSVFSTVECAGNGRSFLHPRVEGVQWAAGAVGHAEWAGVPLHVLLEDAGLKRETIELVFEGADNGIEDSSQPDQQPRPFARSLPLEKALHPDTLLATHMNGEPLEPSHGAPVRLMVPGWYGVASVKWLTRIQAVSCPFKGYYQTVKYTVRRQSGSGLTTEVLGPMPVKSEIIRPTDGGVVGIGTNRIFGIAWAGEHAVAAVEVSIDGGETWHKAELQGPRAPYSWILWEYLWAVDSPGQRTILSRAVSTSGEVQPMRHDSNRGGYSINFSRPSRVRVEPDRLSYDLAGDLHVLRQEMEIHAREQSERRLDADLEFAAGAGI